MKIDESLGWLGMALIITGIILIAVGIYDISNTNYDIYRQVKEFSEFMREIRDGRVGGEYICPPIPNPYKEVIEDAYNQQAVREALKPLDKALEQK